MTEAGQRAIASAVQSNPRLALTHLHGMDLAEYDDTLPDHVKEANNGNGNKAVLEHYRDRNEAGTQTVRRFRLVFVGDPRVGKTRLACFLSGRAYPPAGTPADDTTTHGIETSACSVWRA